jgi:hypothetical protein
MNRQSRSGLGCRRWAGRFAMLGLLGYATVAMSLPSQVYGQAQIPPQWLRCATESLAIEAVLNRSLSPSDGATVTVGTNVAFSGVASAPVTFAIASSPGDLASPENDHGSSTVQPELASPGAPTLFSYAFSSTTAAATPGTVYWDASFSNENLPECEGVTPEVYTTGVHTLTVLPVAVETPAATPQVESETPSSSAATVSGATIAVENPHAATVNLQCTDACRGELKLSIERRVRGHRQDTTIGASAFAINDSKSISKVDVALDARARIALDDAHGRLNALLTITDLLTLTSETHTQHVVLVERRRRG